MKLIRKNNQPDSKENVELLKSDFSRQLWKSMFFALAAVSVIVIASIAWFVSNSRVHSSTASVSADFEPIKLATRGDRQQGEVEHLALAEGNKETYNGKEYYCTEDGTIALRLDGTDHEVSPGSKGKVEFYIIPNGSTSSVTLHIGLGGYGEDEEDGKKVKLIEDDVLKALMSGHILLFDNYENGEYSDWLFSSGGSNGSIFNNTITIDLSGKSANDPVPVDFYWIWPLRYENMVNDFKEIQGFINEQVKDENMSNLNESYRYSRIFLTEKNADLNQDGERSKAYDLADEYIGSNAQYLYLTIQISADDNMEGGGNNEKK